MNSLDKSTFLRVLKGSPLSVLIALAVHGPMGRKQIIVKTGWKKAAVDDALAFLNELDLIARPHYRKWALTDSFYQLPMPFKNPESPLNGLSDPILTIEATSAESPKNGTSEVESPFNGLSPLVVSSRSTTTTKSNLPPPSTPSDSDILAACHQCGIFGEKAKQLARMPHVVEAGPDYVLAHVANAKAVPLAIWRMERGWSIPKAQKKSNDELSNQIPDEYKDIIKR